MPPPYPVSQPISTPSDVKKDEAGYDPPQVAGYPTGLGPRTDTKRGFPQQGYPAQSSPSSTGLPTTVISPSK